MIHIIGVFDVKLDSLMCLMDFLFKNTSVVYGLISCLPSPLFTGLPLRILIPSGLCLFVGWVIIAIILSEAWWHFMHVQLHCNYPYCKGGLFLSCSVFLHDGVNFSYDNQLPLQAAGICPGFMARVRAVYLKLLVWKECHYLA